jgi:hypothetical protein
MLSLMYARTVIGFAAALLTAALCAAAAAAGVARTAPGNPGARASASATGCNRYWSQGDAEAREIVRSAFIAAETISVNHNGYYTNVSLASVHANLATIPVTPRQADRSHGHAYLQAASGTEDSFIVTARAFDGDTYSVQQNANGALVHLARECGQRRHW